jgi:hypothetical protein
VDAGAADAQEFLIERGLVAQGPVAQGLLGGGLGCDGFVGGQGEAQTARSARSA